MCGDIADGPVVQRLRRSSRLNNSVTSVAQQQGGAGQCNHIDAAAFDNERTNDTVANPDRWACNVCGSSDTQVRSDVREMHQAHLSMISHSPFVTFQMCLHCGLCFCMQHAKAHAIAPGYELNMSCHTCTENE